LALYDRLAPKLIPQRENGIRIYPKRILCWQEISFFSEEEKHKPHQHSDCCFIDLLRRNPSEDLAT
jgi:hypothetical protein